MADIVDEQTRSRMMSGIRSRDTKPELVLRSALHRRGFRFRKNVSSLRGKPDAVFPKYRAIVFCHGCFWHMHECHIFRWPSTRASFWREKLQKNAERDVLNRNALRAEGWRVATVWECAFRNRGKQTDSELYDEVAEWLIGDREEAEFDA